jgi:hypothetical protein
MRFGSRKDFLHVIWRRPLDGVTENKEKWTIGKKEKMDAILIHIKWDTKGRLFHKLLHITESLSSVNLIYLYCDIGLRDAQKCCACLQYK